MMVNAGIDNIVDQLKRDEGLRCNAYRCTEGVLTIGYGHTGGVKEGDKITPEKAESLLLTDITTHKRQLLKALPWASELSKARFGVLLNMCFNLGLNGLLGFKNTLRCIQEGKYAEASARMMESKWAKQVGSRAKRLSTQMLTDQWQ